MDKFCVFCKIVEGAIPSNKLYEDDTIMAFHDINPQAPVHVVIIPKLHIAESANDINDENKDVIAHIFASIPKIAKLAGVSSYRIINNCGADAGQTVMHIHFHLLGGKDMGEKLV